MITTRCVMLDPERGVSTLCPFEPESVARNHLSSLNHRGRILANASLGARVLTTRSLTLVPPLVRRRDPSQEAPLAKKPRPADSAGDKDDDDDEDVVVEKRGAPYSGASGDAKDGDDDDEGEREIADGDDFERRRKRGGASGATKKNKNTNLDDGDDEEDEMANDEARGAERVTAGLRVQPSIGRLLVFSSGVENMHEMIRVTHGTRVAIQFWFACDGMDPGWAHPQRVAFAAEPGYGGPEEPPRGAPPRYKAPRPMPLPAPWSWRQG